MAASEANVSHGSTRRFGTFPFNKFQFDADWNEWRRILSSGNSRGPLLDGHPRVHRVRLELEHRQKRRLRTFAWWSLTAADLALLYALAEPLPNDLTVSWAATMHVIYSAWGHASVHLAQWHNSAFGSFSNPHTAAWYVVAMAAGLLFSLLYGLMHAAWRALKALGESAVYVAGFQFVPGARVLDPAPISAALAETVAQKAHGSAGFEEEFEPIDIALGNRKAQ